jgi:hypothetical protein
MKKIDAFMLFVLGIILGGLIVKIGPVKIFDNINLSVAQNLNETNENKSLKYFKNKYERFELVDAVLED